MKDKSKLSIIIPVLNEGKTITNLIEYLRANCYNSSAIEIIIVDGGSTDNTIEKVLLKDEIVYKSQRGRAKQMNLGAQKALGQILYFLHADTYPPKNFDQFILNTVTPNHEAGCFKMTFNSRSWLLNFFAWFTRYNFKFCRGGDQSLFITKSLFNKTKGFNEDYTIFEDNEFIGRLYEETNFRIIPKFVKTSARKYEEIGIVKLQYHFGVIHLKNFLGAGPDKLYAYYKKHITY